MDEELMLVLANRNASRRGIFIEARIVSMVGGDLQTAVLLSQILYWFEPDSYGQSKLRVAKDGTLWLVKKASDWKAECFLTIDQVRRATARLVEIGYIETNTWKYNGVPMLHMRIVPEKFLPDYHESAVLEPESIRATTQVDSGYSPSPFGLQPESTIQRLHTETTYIENSPQTPESSPLKPKSKTEKPQAQSPKPQPQTPKQPGASQAVVELLRAYRRGLGAKSDEPTNSELDAYGPRMRQAAKAGITPEQIEEATRAAKDWPRHMVNPRSIANNLPALLDKSAGVQLKCTSSTKTAIEFVPRGFDEDDDDEPKQNDGRRTEALDAGEAGQYPRLGHVPDYTFEEAAAALPSPWD